MPRSSIIKIEKKFLGGLDISDETGYIRSNVRHVRWTFLTPMFDNYFERILLIIILIDPILLSLAS
jgi:hypothetical protein